MKYVILFFLLCFYVLYPQTDVNWTNIGPEAGSDLHVIKFHPMDENQIRLL